MNDYLYDVDEAQYSFVRVPKLLLQHEAYQRISSEAKLLYSLLLDRVGLSHKNGWRDKQNRIYIIYPIAEVMEEMNCGKNKAVQLLDELEQKAGLIERKRQGLGKPNLIYVKSFSRTVDNFGERHFLKFENQTSGGLNIKPQEVSESNPTNTDNKKTDMNQTDLSFLPGRESKRNDAYAQYEDYFREELEIPILIQGNPREKETLEGILDLLAETCSSKRKTIRIAKKQTHETELPAYPICPGLPEGEHDLCKGYEAVSADHAFQCPGDDRLLLSGKGQLRYAQCPYMRR